MAVTYTLADAFNAFAPNRGVGAMNVVSTANLLLADMNKTKTLKDAGKLSSIKITGPAAVNAADAAWLLNTIGVDLDVNATLVVTDTLANLLSLNSFTKPTSLVITGDNTLTLGANAATNTANLALVALTKFRLGASATLTLAGTGAQVVLADTLALGKVTKFTVTDSGAADATKIAAYTNFKTGSSITILDSAVNLSNATYKNGIAAATTVTLSGGAALTTLTVDQAKALAALGAKFTLTTGATLALSASTTDLLAINTVSSNFLPRVTTLTLFGTNKISFADYQKLAPSLASTALTASSATLEISDTKDNLIAATASLTAYYVAHAGYTKASSVSITGTNTVNATEFAALAAFVGVGRTFSVATGGSLTLSGTAQEVMNAAARATATKLAVTGVTAANIGTIIGYTNLGTFTFSDTYSAINTYITGSAPNLANLKKATSIEVTGNLTDITALRGVTSYTASKVILADTAANLLLAKAAAATNDSAKSLAKATSVTLSANATGITVADAVKLTALVGFSRGYYSFEIADTAANILAAAPSLLQKANQIAVTTVLGGATVAQAIKIQAAADYLGLTVSTLSVIDTAAAVNTALTADKTSLALATAITASGNYADVALLATSYRAAGFKNAPTASITLAETAISLGTAYASLTTDQKKALGFATGLSVIGAPLTYAQAKVLALNAVAANAAITDGLANVHNAALGSLSVTAVLPITDSKTALLAATATTGDDATAKTFITTATTSDTVTVANVGTLVTNFSAAKLVALSVVDTPAALVAAGTLSSLYANSALKTYVSSIKFSSTANKGTDDLVSIAEAATLLTTLGATKDATSTNGTLVVQGTASDLLASNATVKAAATSYKILAGGATLSLADAKALFSGKGTIAFAATSYLQIQDTAAAFLNEVASPTAITYNGVATNLNAVLTTNKLNVDLSLTAAGTLPEYITAAQAVALAGIFGGAHVAIPAAAASRLVVKDTFGALTSTYTGSATAEALAKTVVITGGNGTIAALDTFKTTVKALASNTGVISLASDAAFAVTGLADVAAALSSVNAVNANLIADKALYTEIELTSVGSAGIEGSDYATNWDVYTKIGLADGTKPALTIALTAADTQSFAALEDNQMVNVAKIDAHLNAGNTVINLAKQLEGFNILGVNSGSYTNNITGGQGADSIVGGVGVDTFRNFGAGDTIDGGGTSSDVDVLVLTGTNAELNGAADGRLVNVEKIDASTATAATTISLSNQTDGFIILGSGTVANTITGSSGADTITGGTGTDKILGGSGDDVITSYTALDTIDGGAGADTIKIAAADVASVNAMSGVVDALITGVEKIDLTAVTANIVLDLSKQVEGFTILGTTNTTYTNNIKGGAGANNITGSANADTITGGAGADTITGGAGADLLKGNGGANVFVYTAASDSKLGSSGASTESDDVTVVGLNAGQKLTVGGITVTAAATATAAEVATAIVNNAALSGKLAVSGTPNASWTRSAGAPGHVIFTSTSAGTDATGNVTVAYSHVSTPSTNAGNPTNGDTNAVNEKMTYTLAPLAFGQSFTLCNVTITATTDLTDAQAAAALVAALNGTPPTGATTSGTKVPPTGWTAPTYTVLNSNQVVITDTDSGFANQVNAGSITGVVVTDAAGASVLNTPGGVSSTSASTMDTISDLTATDKIDVIDAVKTAVSATGGLIKNASLAFSTSLESTISTYLAATDVANVSKNFVANAAAILTITGGGSDAGTYLVLNNGTAGFSAADDQVIKVTAAAQNLNASSFI